MAPPDKDSTLPPAKEDGTLSEGRHSHAKDETPPPVDRQTPLKTLHSRNFVCGR